MNKHTPSLMTARNRDFMNTCRKIIATSHSTELTCAGVAAIAATTPAPSYYISFDYALRLIRADIEQGLSSTAAARIADIKAAVAKLMESRKISDSEALATVLAGPAPAGFYLTPSSALRLFHKLRSQSPFKTHLKTYN